MKQSLKRSLFTLITALAFFLTVNVAVAAKPTIVDKLIQTDGAQALVAAVLVVDDAQVLPFSIAELLGDKKAEVVLFAPGNAAFEELLNLEPGFLNGLTIAEVQAALPGALTAAGVDVTGVANILVQHVSLPKKANLRRASENALLSQGSVTVADESIYTVGVGANGVQVNYETTIIKADVSVRNGVIHFIDTVIVDDALDPPAVN